MCRSQRDQMALYVQGVESKKRSSLFAGVELELNISKARTFLVLYVKVTKGLHRPHIRHLLYP